MDVEDKEWAQLAPLLLQNGDDAFPDHLHPYLSGVKNIFDDIHGGVQDAHLLFGGPVDGHDSVSIANQARSSNEPGNGQLESYNCSNNGKVAASAAVGVEIKLPIDRAASNTCPNSNNAQAQSYSPVKVQQTSTASLSQQQQQTQPGVPAIQQQQPGQHTAGAAASAQLLATVQQQQQQSIPQPQTVQVNLAQLQQLQQQQAFAGYQPQPIWGLQQQLWTLQQQSALIAAQQQQQQQFAGVTMTAPMLVPMGLSTGFGNAMALKPVANGIGSAAFGTQAINGQGNLAAAMTPADAAGLQLYGFTQGLQAPAPAAQYGLAAAAAAAANGHKRQRSFGRTTAGVAAASPSAAAAAAMAAATAAHHFGKPTTVAKKQRERHRSVVSSLEAEVAEKLTQLQLLSAENEMLKLRAAVLEATVANREDQMRVISEHGPPVYPIDVTPAPAATSSDTGSPRSSSATPGVNMTGSKRAKAFSNLANELRSSASTVGELVVQPTTPRSAAAAEAAADAAAVGGYAAAAVGGYAAAAVGGYAAAAVGDYAAEPEDKDAIIQQVQDLDGASNAAAVFGAKPVANDEFWPNVQEGREVIKRMSVEDVVRHWKQFLHDVTGELVNVQKEESMLAFKQQKGRQGSCAPAAASEGAAGSAEMPPVGQECSTSMKRINELVEKYSFLIKTAQQLNPGAYCRLFGQNLDTGLPAPYSDAHWRRVVSVLGLSKQQVNHILACAELYFSCRAKLQNEQRVLQQQLKATCTSMETLLLSGASDDNPMKPWLEKLANNLKREHVLRVMLNGFVWFKVFSPVQCAKASVYSHPFYVDVHAMVCVMCEDALASSAGSAQRTLVFPHRAQAGASPQAVM